MAVNDLIVLDRILCTHCNVDVHPDHRGLDGLCPGCRNGVTYPREIDYGRLAGILAGRNARMTTVGLVVYLPDEIAEWCALRWGGKLYVDERRLTMWRLKMSDARTLVDQLKTKGLLDNWPSFVVRLSNNR